MLELSDLTRTVRTKAVICTDPHSHGDVEGPCWVWTGSTDRYGYAQVRMRNVLKLVHRYTWEFLHGPIPDGLTIDHLCSPHRNCINPHHFEVVSREENSRRANVRRWNPDYDRFAHLQGEESNESH